MTLEQQHGQRVSVTTFQSRSDPRRSYETIRYADGYLSCNCAGWTRRVSQSGGRTCKHVRALMGMSGMGRPSESVFVRSITTDNTVGDDAILVANPDMLRKQEAPRPKKSLKEVLVEMKTRRKITFNEPKQPE